MYHTYIHVCIIHTYMHTSIHADKRPFRSSLTEKGQIHIYILCIYVCMCTFVMSCSNIYSICTYIHIYIYTRIQAYVYMSHHYQ